MYGVGIVLPCLPFSPQCFQQVNAPHSPVVGLRPMKTL